MRRITYTGSLLFQQDLQQLHEGRPKQDFREVLLEINALLESIASPNKVYVQVCSGSLAPSVGEFMQELGWIVEGNDEQACAGATEAGNEYLTLFLYWTIGL